MKFIDKIKKEDIIRCLDILFYEYSELLSINYEFVDKFNYEKIILIYDTINMLLNKLYESYGKDSIYMLKKWHKKIRKYDYDILHECIYNFIEKHKYN